MNYESTQMKRNPGFLFLEKVLPWLGLLFLVCLAGSRRALLDDAFISFRYAQNMAHGFGLVWNPGERVEGYTNFLWVLIFVPIIKAGWDPVAASYAAGLVSFAFSLYFTGRLARTVLGSKFEAWMCVILLGTNYSFSGSSGTAMETQMQTAFLTGAASFALDFLKNSQFSKLRMSAFSLLCACSLLTRLDSSVYFFPLWGLCILKTFQEKRLPLSEKRAYSLALTAPLGLISGIWFCWKYFYYGDILPNTFYFRFLQTGSLLRGIAYISAFFVFYGLGAFPFLGVLALLRGWKSPSFCKTAFLMVLGGWLFYVILARGDYLEFRFLIAILPLLFIGIVWTLRVCVPRPWLRVAMAALIGLVSVQYPVSYNRIPWVVELPYHYDVMERWIGIGQVLGRDLGENKDVSIAVGPAGAIPYYSGLHSVDMLGHADPWVVRHGVVREPTSAFLGSWPGHGKIAPLDYLVKRKVNLVMAHPWYIKTQRILPKEFSQNQVMEWGEYMKGFNFIKEGQIPAGARMVRVPITKTWGILMLYLTPHPAIERLLADGTWKAYGIQGV